MLCLFSALLVTSYNVVAQESKHEEAFYVLEIAWSPDGTQLAIVGAHDGITGTDSNDESGYLSVVDGLNGNAVFVIEPTSAFTSVAWSPDGQRLALGSFDGTVWIVNALTGERITNLFGHQSTVTDVDWNSSGTQIISSGNWDELVILWDASNYTSISQITTTAHPYAVAFSSDDRSIAVGTEVGLFLFSIDNQPLARISPEDRVVREWIFHLAYSPDGRYIAAGTIANVSSISGIRDNARIIVFDVSTGTVSHQFESSLGSIGGISWSADNQYLAVLNEDNVMSVWDVENEVGVSTYATSGIDRYDKGGVSYSLYGGRIAFSGTRTSTSDLQSSSSAQDLTTWDNGAVQIVVPVPSLERLQTLTEACNATATTGQVLSTNVQIDQVSAFAEEVEALPEDTIAPACVADLLAMIEVLETNP